MQQNATKHNNKAQQCATSSAVSQEPIATLGVRELADIFGCSEATIRTIRSRTPANLPPAIVIGRKQFWLQETVRAWLLERQEQPNVK